MLMAGPAPVVRPSASHYSYSDFDDDLPMDEDEHIDYADQEPLILPTPTGVRGPMVQFLLDMPDVIPTVDAAC